uniref:phenylalanine--tRNA ligase n=1 Tax=Tetradesmus obliquus TaxID=3088 RepID=A0A383VUV0_TETOB
MRAATLKGAQRALMSACMPAPVAARARTLASASPAVCSCSYSSTSSSSSPLATLGSSLGLCGRQQRPFARINSSSSARSRRALRPLATAAVEARRGPAAPAKDQVLTSDPANNVTEYIYSKMGINLHHQPNHPIGIIKQAIYDYFEQGSPGVFKAFDDMYPVVACTANFDEILIPADHVSRSPNDTYYVSADKVLRCHTSAHQAELLRTKQPAFLVTGDVYRRDSIDATHYPVFHQMEGVRIYGPADWEAAGLEATAFAERELKSALEGLAKHLFGDVECRWGLAKHLFGDVECRWVDAYFPFTEPSFELEIFFNGKWMEVLGCGVMEQVILDKNYGEGHKAWAFGLGLERLAMVLFDIPDIRLFWSDDDRFLKQFKAGDLNSKFKSYSKFPPCYKDMAFWVSPEFTENNLCELVRGIGGDLVEEVVCIDNFTNPKTQRTSNCYRITYRSMERSLTDEEINGLQARVRQGVAEQLKVELR